MSDETPVGTILTADDALAWMDEKLAEDRADILAADGYSLHHGLGQSLRNELGLWVGETPLHQHFVKARGITHPDDMSHFLIEHYQAWLQTPRPLPHERGYVKPKAPPVWTGYNVIVEDHDAGTD